MSGDWGFAGTDYLAFTSGDVAMTGAYTLVALVEPDSTGGRFVGVYNGATEQASLMADAGALYGLADFSSGYAAGVAAAKGWMIVAITKAGGSAQFRYHYWDYASDGSGTMNHGVATSPGNHANGSGATQIRVGYTQTAGNDGMIANVMVLDRELSDAELDTLKSAELSDWFALAPDFGVELSAWNGTTGAVVWAGSSTFSAETGTVGSGTNPSGFNFTLVPPLPEIPDLGNESGWTLTDLYSHLLDHDFRSVLVVEGWFDRQLTVQGWFDDELIFIESGIVMVEFDGWGVSI